MSTKRVPGWASSTAGASPGPKTAICDRLARRRLAPKAASPSDLVGLGLAVHAPDPPPEGLVATRIFDLVCDARELERL
jgi:hypothetical protein